MADMTTPPPPPESGVSDYVVGVIIIVVGSTLQSLGLSMWKMSHLRTEKLAKQQDSITRSQKFNSYLYTVHNVGDAVWDENMVNVQRKQSDSDPEPAAPPAPAPKKSADLEEIVLDGVHSFNMQSHVVDSAGGAGVPTAASQKKISLVMEARNLNSEAPTPEKGPQPALKRVPSLGHNGTMEDAYRWFVNNSAADLEEREPDEAAKQELERLARLQKNRSAFLIWLAGFIVFAVGNVGDFVSLGLTRQSVVTLVGSWALVVNTMTAKCMAGEDVIFLDLLSIAFIIGGIVLTVLSSSQESDEWDLPRLIVQYQQVRVVIMNCILAAVIIACGVTISMDRIARIRRAKARNAVLVENASRFIGFLTCLMGSLVACFTVLFGKAVSGLLLPTILGDNKFTDSFAVFIVLIFCVSLPMQLMLINASLAVNDALYHIPNFYVFWNTGSIITGAIFYEEMDKFGLQSWILFPCGVVVLFFGVFLVNLSMRKKQAIERTRAEERLLRQAWDGGEGPDGLRAQSFWDSWYNQQAEAIYGSGKYKVVRSFREIALTDSVIKAEAMKMEPFNAVVSGPMVSAGRSDVLRMHRPDSMGTAYSIPRRLQPDSPDQYKSTGGWGQGYGPNHNYYSGSSHATSHHTGGQGYPDMQIERVQVVTTPDLAQYDSMGYVRVSAQDQHAYVSTDARTDTHPMYDSMGYVLVSWLREQCYDSPSGIAGRLSSIDYDSPPDAHGPIQRAPTLHEHGEGDAWHVVGASVMPLNNLNASKERIVHQTTSTRPDPRYYFEEREYAPPTSAQKHYTSHASPVPTHPHPIPSHNPLAGQHYTQQHFGTASSYGTQPNGTVQSYGTQPSGTVQSYGTQQQSHLPSLTRSFFNEKGQSVQPRTAQSGVPPLGTFGASYTAGSTGSLRSGGGGGGGGGSIRQVVLSPTRPVQAPVGPITSSQFMNHPVQPPTQSHNSQIAPPGHSATAM